MLPPVDALYKTLAKPELQLTLSTWDEKAKWDLFILEVTKIFIWKWLSLKAYLCKEVILVCFNIGCVEISAILFCIFSGVFEIQ